MVTSVFGDDKGIIVFEFLALTYPEQRAVSLPYRIQTLRKAVMRKRANKKLKANRIHHDNAHPFSAKLIRSTNRVSQWPSVHSRARIWHLGFPFVLSNRGYSS